MFTGIVETTGTVVAIEQWGTNHSFWIESPISGELKTDQSVAHDGVCLTVEMTENGRHRVTAIEETLDKSHLGSWATGSIINLERCMAMNGRLDGHLVQGHVDATGTCLQVEDHQGSWLYTFSFPEKFAGLMIEKGSICLNGISLTAFNVANDRFSVAIIPYTYEHTNMKNLVPGSLVNLEFDMIGKYIVRNLQLQNKGQ
jgi:riboflavin synthase